MIFLVAGCATLYNPATGKKEFIWINSQTEVALGEGVEAELVKKHPLAREAILQSRVEAIGRRLAKISDRQDIDYKFFVLADEELNALTLPGGFIYVNKGLLNILNDAELAYVLGHEIGHVAARHIAKKIQTNMGYQLLLGVAFSAMGGGSAGSTGAVAQGVDTVYNLIALSYSRKDEFEADRLAVKYTLRAGFDPYASLAALEKIKKEEGPNWKILSYFRTHPYVDERISALKTAIPQLSEQNHE